jgi:hypothetical protein
MPARLSGIVVLWPTLHYFLCLDRFFQLTIPLFLRHNVLPANANQRLRGFWMKIGITLSVLTVLLFLAFALPAAGAQYAAPAYGDQSNAPYGGEIYLNEPYGGVPGTMYPAGFGQYAAPLDAYAAPPVLPDAVPLTAPVVPYTSGFTHSAQSSSAYGPFTPPVAQASEQYYQYPGLTPYGAYPGSGFAYTNGIGFDPASGYYGPFGAATYL